MRGTTVQDQKTGWSGWNPRVLVKTTGLIGTVIPLFQKDGMIPGGPEFQTGLLFHRSRFPGW
jgi:hypothetical protein